MATATAFTETASPDLSRRFSQPGTRSGSSHPPAFQIGSLTIDPYQRDVRINGTRLALTKKEYGLLVTLAREPHRVFTREELLAAVWDLPVGWGGATRTLDAHAQRLRAKLAVDGDRFVINVWGVGYRLLDAIAPTVAVEPARPERQYLVTETTEHLVTAGSEEEARAAYLAGGGELVGVVDLTVQAAG